jgi:hypothetical protein
MICQSKIIVSSYVTVVYINSRLVRNWGGWGDVTLPILHIKTPILPFTSKLTYHGITYNTTDSLPLEISLPDISIPGFIINDAFFISFDQISVNIRDIVSFIRDFSECLCKFLIFCVPKISKDLVEALVQMEFTWVDSSVCSIHNFYLLGFEF